jgi:twitching motility two-component system response regulator PilH
MGTVTATKEQQELEGSTVLVVDDEPDTLTFICTVLEDHGAATLRATHGEEALALARRERPDLMTLDLSMPGKSGVEVFSALRADPELVDLAVCIITGRPELRQLVYEHRPPPEGYLNKPVNEEALLRTVRKILELGARRRSR